MTKARWIILSYVLAGILLLVVYIYERELRSYQQPREGEEGKAPPTFLSPTECIGADGQPAHGAYRWAAKVDEEQPPAESWPWFEEINQTTIAAMAAWPDLLSIKTDSPRRGQELWWYQLTGKVVLVKCEDDGDLHIQLGEVGGMPGPQVVTEVPLDEPWNAIRQEVFSWSDVTFPCKPHKLKLKKHPVIRVTGKAFYDGIHAGKIPNRRSYDSNVTVWEIHPVMKLEVIGE